MSRRISNREESRLRGLAGGLESQAENEIVQQPINFSWVRRRVVEGRYLTTRGEVSTPRDMFDLWLEDPPGDPVRDPTLQKHSSRAAAEALVKYETNVRLS